MDFQSEFDELDRRCESLTVEERFLGDSRYRGLFEKTEKIIQKRLDSFLAAMKVISRSSPQTFSSRAYTVSRVLFSDF